MLFPGCDNRFTGWLTGRHPRDAWAPRTRVREQHAPAHSGALARRCLRRCRSVCPGGGGLLAIRPTGVSRLGSAEETPHLADRVADVGFRGRPPDRRRRRRPCPGTYGLEFAPRLVRVVPISSQISVFA